MSRKTLARVLVAACLLLPTMARATSTSTNTVTVNGTVAPFAEWTTTTATITIGTSLSSVAVPQTGSVALTLYANEAVTITAAGGTNSGILTDGSANTVTTKYKLTGAGLQAPDGAFKAATAAVGGFFNAGNTYDINYVSGTGSYAVTLSVEMSATGAAAPVSGNYSCDIVLTATF